MKASMPTRGSGSLMSTGSDKTPPRGGRRVVTMFAIVASQLGGCKDRQDAPIVSDLADARIFPVPTPTASSAMPSAATTIALDDDDDLSAALSAHPELSAQLAAIGCPGGVCKPRNDDPALIRCCRRQAEIMRSDPAWPEHGAPARPEDVDVCVLMLENTKPTNPAGVDATVKCMDLAKDAKGALLCMLQLSAKGTGK